MIRGDTMVFEILKLIWSDGDKLHERYKWFLAFNIFLAVMMIVSLIMVNFTIAFILALVFFVINIAIAYRYYLASILPFKQMRAFFDNMFQEMNFQTSGRYPHFLSQEDKYDLVKAYNFTTYCPLKTWLEKKDLFEMHLNEKILDIKQDENNKRLVSIHIEKEPLADMIKWDDWYLNRANVFAIGICHYGIVCMHLERDPHAFIAGETGGGKSNILKCLIYQALYKDYEVELIDFKRGVSFSQFRDKVTIHYEYTEVIKVLRDMVTETTNRLDKFRYAEVDNINDYNKRGGDYLKRKVLFIDELAELMSTSDKETSKIIKECLETLTRLSRAAGIHLILGIQRPDSTIISGQIKNNVPFRICGRFVDKGPSVIMFGNAIASSLPNIKGRFIVKEDDFYETQCFFFEGATKHVDTSKQPTEEYQRLEIATQTPNEHTTAEYQMLERPIHTTTPQKPVVKPVQQEKTTVRTKTDTFSSIPPKQKTQPPKQPAEPKELEKQSKQSKEFEFDFSEFKK